MKFLYLLCSVFLFAVWSPGAACANGLYINTFGKSTSPAVIFLHGGPGYNAASFELSTAARLADSGYFVIVYDSRGTGRSTSESAAYTYESEIQDLKHIYSRYGLKSASLLGHSFGGSVAIKFAQQHPEAVQKIVLISAPLDYPMTFKTILKRCRDYYSQHQPASLTYINMLDTMNAATLGYATYSFMNAMACKLYNTQTVDPEAAAIYKRMRTDTSSKYLTLSKPDPVTGFFRNEAYTTRVFYNDVKGILTRTPVYGIYGDEDGLFDQDQLERIKKHIGIHRFAIISSASHAVFIDKQTAFVDTLIGFLKLGN
jgi:proline iminopeptidase